MIDILFHLPQAYLHVFIELLWAIISHDIDAFKTLNYFAVWMIQSGTHHVTADSDSDLAFWVLNQYGAVESDEDTKSEVFLWLKNGF